MRPDRISELSRHHAGRPVAEAGRGKRRCSHCIGRPVAEAGRPVAEAGTGKRRCGVLLLHYLCLADAVGRRDDLMALLYKPLLRESTSTDF